MAAESQRSPDPVQDVPDRTYSPSPVSKISFSPRTAAHDDIQVQYNWAPPTQPFIAEKHVPHASTLDSTAYSHQEEIQHGRKYPHRSSGAGPASPHANGRRWLLHRLWLWELGASILSLACVASIAAVASSQQGKPLEQWRRGLGKNISPTAVVSFLGAIGKSACLVALASIVSQLKWLHFTSGTPRKLSDLQLFDDASRGPMGALLVILLRNKTALLASCASVLTLGSLLLDPFAQLIFDFPSELRPAPGKAPEIRSSHMYDPFALPRQISSCYGPARVESTMQGAILAPLWDVSPAPNLPCSFERCEWPSVTTLGVCSSCVDLTDDVTADCRLKENIAEGFECNYTITSINTTLAARFGMIGGASYMKPYNTQWNSTATAVPNPPDDEQPPKIGEFAFVRFEDGIDWEEFVLFEDDERRIHSTPPIKQAMQCSLDLCARTLEKPYFANFSAGPLTGKDIPLKFSSIPDEIAYVPQYITLAPEDTAEHPELKDETFTINYCDFLDIADYLASLFTLEWLTTGVAPTAPTTTNARSPTRQKVTPNIGLMLSQTTNMTALMISIAGSMTEAFRTSANSTAVDGTGLNTVTYISIEWAWLSLPLAVVTLAFVMLVVVIVRNHARGVPAWKSSSLALLFHELDGWEEAKTRGLDGPLEVESRAAEMRARVVNEHGVLSFSKA
jgi:hypothetical protein